MKQKTKPITPWHRLLGKLFELLLTPLGITVTVDFKLMSDPPRGDILLLRREQPYWTAEQLAYLPDGIRNSQASDILVEFKYTESLTGQMIAKVLSYDTLYREIQELPTERVESFILCSKTPRPKLLKDYGYRPTEWAGVYQSGNILLEHVKILVLNDLSNDPHNAFVKCFASRIEVVQLAFKVLDLGNWSRKLWGFLLGLQNSLIKKGVIMTRIKKIKEITPEDVMDLGERIFEAMLASMPTKEVLSRYKAEEVLAQYKPEERLLGLKSEEVLSRYKFEEVLSRYKPEEVLSRYNPEERLFGLKSEEVLSRYKPEEVLSRYNPEERLFGLKSEEVLSRYKPEEVLARYKPELERREEQAKCQTMLQQIERTLRLRFRSDEAILIQVREHLAKLDLTTLEQLSEVAILASQLADFEVKLQEILNTRLPAPQTNESVETMADNVVL